MRVGAAALLVFAAAFLFPPWRLVATWESKATGEVASEAAQAELNRKFFGDAPYTFSWFWRAPTYESISPGGVTSLETSPDSYTAYRFSSSEVSTRIHFVALLVVASLASAITAVFASGLLRLSRGRLAALELTAVCAALLSCVFFGSTALRYIIFFSGGSGFVVPVPLPLKILFTAGTAGAASSVAVLRFPRIASTVTIVCLLLIAGTVLQQLATHERPAEVLFVRGFMAAVLAAIAAGLYALFLRPSRRAVAPAA